MTYDAIIIGGGLGGLTAGAKLSKEGRKVLLIEQHSQPGGCATTFRRGEFTLEVGLHEMDGPGPRDMKTRIFADLGVSEKVELVRIPEFYHFIGGNLEITIPHNPVDAAAILKQRFPGEENAIDSYFRLLLPAGKRNEGTQQADTSVGVFLDSITANEDLKLVLLGNLGYFHDDPYSLSLAYYAIAQGSYYSGGASFIKGGSQALSDHLAGFIESHGGEVLLNHIVTGVETANGRLQGVKYMKKRGASGPESFAEGKEIIVSSSLPSFASMLPEADALRLRENTASLKPGASLLTVYFGFSKALKELGHRHYSTFVYDASVKKQADILPNNRADFAKRSFTFVDYSQIDSGLAPEGKSVGAICCTDYLPDWENLSPEVYEAGKETAARHFIARLEKIIPGFSDAIQYYEVGTAKTVNRYTLNDGGAVYGFAQTPGKKYPEISEIYENMSVASAWGKTGGGFSGSIYSGYLCAMNILRKRQQ
ncbi:MAG: NAD(P)/FAD-dependent oxidoreductase [Bacteroidales bacterium]|jgi:phytoene dehydrogenase-like protein|nr:NAD(P)/FAD-dependent oxidoreductase [Bacteroidales bacterium]